MSFCENLKIVAQYKVVVLEMEGCRPLRGLGGWECLFLGLAPQALCFRPLRGLARLEPNH
jgi:hypothetical protein